MATFSVFERLTDDQPRVKKEAPFERWVGVPEYRNSVLAHLEALLNTRRSDEDIDPNFPEANQSVLTYGIADFTSMSSSDPAERERIRRSIERAIRLFEPRLARVDVRLAEWDKGNSAICIEIEGMLRLGFEEEPILVQAVLAKDSRQFEVTEGS